MSGAAVSDCRAVARESTTGVWVQPAMGAGGYMATEGKDWEGEKGKRKEGRREEKRRERKGGTRREDITNRTTHSYGSLDSFTMRGMEGNSGNGEETAGSLCRYTVGMMYLSGMSGMSGMRGQRESTARYMMRCRLPSLLYAVRFVPRLSLPTVRSQLSQLGLLYSGSTWAVLGPDWADKGQAIFLMAQS